MEHAKIIAQFNEWLDDATKAGNPEPTAMALATATKDGAPAVRMVLLKAADERGFAFYTNLESPKVRDLNENPRAQLCFYWVALKRQVRINGRVEPVSAAEADAYYASRARLSQIGAWASKQSRPMNGYFELEQACAGVALRYPFGDVPRPSFWSGFRVVPDTIEFWKEKPFRRHERILYTREGDYWKEQWLYP